MNEDDSVSLTIVPYHGTPSAKMYQISSDLLPRSFLLSTKWWVSPLLHEPLSTHSPGSQSSSRMPSSRKRGRKHKEAQRPT
eukprot:scaffold2719_cov153-Amphora_coffeaeformis.AAC.5